MTTLATIEQLETRVKGGINAGDLDRAQSLLEDASILVRDMAGRPEWDADTAPPTAFRLTLEAARRALINPDGISQESIGNYSYSLARGAQPGIYLTDAEVKQLQRAADASMMVLTGEISYGD